LELPENVFDLKWVIGTADVKIAVYCGKFTQMLWQGIHHTFSFPELVERQCIFPGKYLNEARNVIDFTSNRAATTEDIFGHCSPNIISLVIQK